MPMLTTYLDQQIVATDHDARTSQSDFSRALTDYVRTATVVGSCNDRVRSHLATALELLDRGHVHSARALVATTLSDLGGAL